jgi:hypothetical protein
VGPGTGSVEGATTATEVSGHSPHSRLEQGEGVPRVMRRRMASGQLLIPVGHLLRPILGRQGSTRECD